jgi:hypothetical protein
MPIGGSLKFHSQNKPLGFQNMPLYIFTRKGLIDDIPIDDFTNTFAKWVFAALTRITGAEVSKRKPTV